MRTAPIALLDRQQLHLLAPLPDADESDEQQGDSATDLSSNATRVQRHLVERGASFFRDIQGATGLLGSQVEDALGELVSAGLATSDAYAGLRTLLTPRSRRHTERRRPRRGATGQGMEAAGRWSLLRASEQAEADEDARVEQQARCLLARYGVVFRKLLERETAPPWRLLLRAYRRLEARGEIRGGRFVDGFSGEQFAEPSAIKRLRAARKKETSPSLCSISAADPLNLVGIVLPGERIAAIAKNRILFRDGLPVAVLEKGEVRFVQEVAPEGRWDAHMALKKRQIPAQLRPYLSS